MCNSLAAPTNAFYGFLFVKELNELQMAWATCLKRKANSQTLTPG